MDAACDGEETPEEYYEWYVVKDHLVLQLVSVPLVDEYDGGGDAKN